MRSCTAYRDVVWVAPLGTQGFAEIKYVTFQVPVIRRIDKMYLRPHEIDRHQIPL